MRNFVSASLLVVMSISSTSAVLAGGLSVDPFESDGCVPGYTADGTFVDEAGTVLASDGWVAAGVGEVVDTAGNRVVLREDCLAALVAPRGNLGVGAVSVLVVGVGVLMLGTNGTNGTDGTN